METLKAQISIEIIYSIGVLLLIFIILSGITFTRKTSVDRTEEFIAKRNTCLSLSTTINSITTMHNNFTKTFKTIYEITIQRGGLILVGDPGSDPKEVEAACTYNGVLEDDEDMTLSAGSYVISNFHKKIRIT